MQKLFKTSEIYGWVIIGKLKDVKSKVSSKIANFYSTRLILMPISIVPESFEDIHDVPIITHAFSLYLIKIRLIPSVFEGLYLRIELKNCILLFWKNNS